RLAEPGRCGMRSRRQRGRDQDCGSRPRQPRPVIESSPHGPAGRLSQSRLRPMEDWLDLCLDAEEMRATDSWAIKDQGVPSLELMETAGRAVAEGAGQAAPSPVAAIVCGKGNNGGDGLVAARALRETGFQVDVLLLAPPDELSDDARANVDRFDGARQVDQAELATALR